MFVNYFMSLPMTKNVFYIQRYLKFISTRTTIKEKYNPSFKP